jgi:hypothetical protein
MQPLTNLTVVPANHAQKLKWRSNAWDHWFRPANLAYERFHAAQEFQESEGRHALDGGVQIWSVLQSRFGSGGGRKTDGRMWTWAALGCSFRGMRLGRKTSWQLVGRAFFCPTIAALRPLWMIYLLPLARQDEEESSSLKLGDGGDEGCRLLLYHERRHRSGTS